MNELKIDVRGMTCASCVAHVEKALLSVPGVASAQVNLVTEKASIQPASGAQEAPLLASVIRAVEAAGYDATATRELTSAVGPRINVDARSLRLKAIGATLLTLPLVLPMLLMPLEIHLHLPAGVQLLLASVVQFYFGSVFYRGAWKALRARNGNMDLLVALGTSAAFGLSLYSGFISDNQLSDLYFESSATILSLVLVGKWLEARAKGQAVDAIRALYALRPQSARILRDGAEAKIPLAELRPGDLAIVLPGEAIPADGVIQEGSTHVDESLLTGESLPVAKSVEDTVIGGSINADGRIVVIIRSTGSETLLASIIRKVEDAQGGKAPIQRIADRVSAIFVPVVLVIAAVTAAGWMMFGASVEAALLHAVAVLVIACPCALGLATPTSILVGTSIAARHGILVQNAEALERAAAITVVAFDKTGTLTLGRPVLGKILPIGVSEDLVLSRAASLQSASEHPLASAVLHAAASKGINPPAPGYTRALPGKGISGDIDGTPWLLGNRALMEEKRIDLSELDAQSDLLSTEGNTLAWLSELGRNPGLRGLLAFRDTVKPEARAAIDSLRRIGVRSVLITGDHAESAAAIAAELGINEVLAGVLPERKAAEIDRMRAGGQTVAMVGDGINDAPALASADVGIAMSTGTDIAMQSAGITLMRGDPRLVASAILLSRATYRKIQQNLFWAFVFNVLGIPLAAFGYLNPMVAGAAMAFSSVSVIGNALTLKRWKPTQNEGTA